MTHRTRFDVNLSMLLTEHPLLERPQRAAAEGFDAVELWWPFESPVPPDRDLDALAGAVEDAGVTLVCLNFDAGDMAAGDRGLLSDPARSDRFQANVDVTVHLAQRLDCRVLNALYGNRVDGVDPAAQDDLAAENLALAAAAAGRVGATVVVEAVNGYDNPRYPLQRTADVLRVLDRVEASSGQRLGLCADLYHVARMGDDPVAVVTTHRQRIGHVQIADVPGRHQPDTGRLPFDPVFDALAAGGYDGYVGLEYIPQGSSENSFAWLERPRRRSRPANGRQRR